MATKLLVSMRRTKHTLEPGIDNEIQIGFLMELTDAQLKSRQSLLKKIGEVKAFLAEAMEKNRAKLPDSAAGDQTEGVSEKADPAGDPPPSAQVGEVDESGNPFDGL